MVDDNPKTKPTKIDPERFYTRYELFELGLKSPKGWERLAASGEGPPYALEGPNLQALYLGADVLAWLERRKIRSSTDAPRSS